MGHKNHFDSSGKALPSVSAVPAIFAKDMSGFQDWICKQVGPHKCCTKAQRDYYKEAADLGNDIHSLREAFLKGETFSEGVPEYQARLFEPIARFYKESGYKPLFIEEDMTGETFGGSLDGAGTFDVPFWEQERKTFWDVSCEGVPFPTDKSVFIEDLKIKSKLDILHPLQLYGYKLLLKENHGVDADWGLIIRREKKLDKRPEIQKRAYYLPYYKPHWDYSIFMWQFLNGEGK